MLKSTPTTKASSGYQKYFDAKSLKSVASCAGIIFIIVHLVDYLWNFTISLRILNTITLLLCLLITFLFVVNELGRFDEKIILGVANAALLFFSVIGFNSTITSSAFLNARNMSRDSETEKTEKTSHWLPAIDPHQQNASLFAFFRVRNWMPPVELERKIDTLARENRILRRTNQLQMDSLGLLKSAASPNSVYYNSNKEVMSANKTCDLRLDSLRQNYNRLLAELQKCLTKSHQFESLSSVPRPISDTSFMDRANYFNSYKVMKQKFESDLKKCQQDADEYRSKYYILMHQSKDLMDRARGREN